MIPKRMLPKPKKPNPKKPKRKNLSVINLNLRNQSFKNKILREFKLTYLSGFRKRGAEKSARPTGASGQPMRKTFRSELI